MASIKPNFAMWANIGAALCGAIAAATPNIFPHFIPSAVAQDVIESCGFITFLFTTINAAAHAYSSTQPGPLAPQDPPSAPK